MAVHKVFLVEDEIVAREGIRDTIAWQELGFTFCGEAPDGEVALPLIRETHPDVLITDIKMPFMDGLQLCKLVREQIPEIKIIILSGYDDFNYAQQAIKLGVTEYLLKPVSAQDLRAVLERVATQLDEEHTSQALLHRMIAQLENSHALRRNKFLLDLMLGQTSTAEALAEAQGLGVELSAPCYLVLFVELRLDRGEQMLSYQAARQAEQIILSLIQERSDIIALHKEPEEIVLLLKGSEITSLQQKAQALAETLRQAITDQTGCTPRIGQGLPKDRLQDVTHSFDEALAAARRVQSSATCAAVQPVDKDALLHLDKAAVEAYLNYGTPAEFDAFFGAHIAPLCQPVLSSGIFKYYFFIDILLTTAHFVNGLGGEVKDLALEVAELEPTLRQIKTTEEIYTRVWQILEEGLAFRDQQAQGEAVKLVAQAQAYIAQHYGNPELSLNAVAAHVSLSPSHFSTVFSHTGDETFKAHLTEVRIRKAKELLCTTGLKVFEIADQVGYNDPHYFSAVFKKVTGLSPTDFRKRTTAKAT